MPMRPITVKANFQLDTSAARAQLQGLQRELSSITKGATMDLGITPQITQAIKEAQQLKSILAEATDFSTGAFDLSKFDAAMKQYGKGISELKQNLQTLGPDGEKAFNSLATTIASAQVPLKRTSQGVKDFVTAFGNTMRWQATSMAMHKMVGTIQQAFNYAQNLDKSLTNIQIVTGHNADYMRNFAKEANKAAQALSASTLEYTNASLIYYQQGLGDKEVAKRAETTLKLAKVTGESASKVSQQMTAVWNNFSNGVDNLERYADVMTALGATTASSSSEIAKGLEKFASVTKTIGLSYDYAASALATVTAQTRQSADSVGTAFKTLFSRLESLNLGETLDDSTTLNKYSEALLKAGVNIMDVNGHLKDMDTILDELGAQWNNLNKAQQVALSQTVGGVRNYTSLITLMDNWEDFQNNIVTSQLAEGTLQRQADIYAQSWEAAQQRVKTASQGIYDTLISSDFFKGFNNALAGTLNLINGVGKSLGTSGSIAGIANLFLGLNGERVAKGIDNFTINTLGQTSFGQNVFRAQQKKILEDLTSNIYDTGVRSSQIRKDVYENLMGSWDEFRNKTYGSKAELQTNQLMMQQLTAQAQNVMNSAIDMDRLKLDSQIASRKAAEIFAGKFGMGQTSDVYTNLTRIFDNQSSDQGAYKAGFSEYLQDTFVTKLTKLASMDIDNSSNQAAQSLKGQIQAQAENAMKNTKIGDIINAEGQGSPLYSAMSAMVGGITKQNIDDIITSLSMYNTDQIQAYEQMRQKLDQDFLKNNPDAVKKETYTVKAGGRSVTKTRVMRDANGNLIMDENSAAAKEYLAQMSDQKQAAVAAQKAGYITEQQAQDILSGNKNLRDVLKPQQEMTTSFGNAAVSAGQMVSSMTMAINSINNFRESIQNGTVTATNTMSMFGSVGLAMGQMIPVLTNTTKILGTGLSVGGLGGIAALATLGIGATVYGINVAKAQGLDAKTGYANESKITAIAQAKEDEQKYETYLPIMRQQQDNIDKLYSLQQGTAEYTAQMIKSNNNARQLIETYGLQSGIDYSIDSNGIINFSAQQIKQTNQDLLDQLKESEAFSQAAISGFTQLTSLQDKKKIQAEINNLLTQTNTDIPIISDEDLYTAFSKAQEIDYVASTFNDPFSWKGGSREAAVNALYSMGLLDSSVTLGDKEKQQQLEDYEQQLHNFDNAAKADFQTVLNSTLSNTEKSEEQQLATIALGLNDKALEEYQQYLEKTVYSTTGFLGVFGDQTATRDSTGGFRSAEDLRKVYMTIFGHQASADIADDQRALASAIENYKINDYLTTLITEVSDQFRGQNLLSDFLNINSKDYASMKDIFTNIENMQISDEARGVYNTFIQKALTDSIKAQDSLVQAMMANSQFNGQEYVKIAQQLQEGAANFSTQQLETLTNYVNSFTNNFGEEAGKAVFDALTNNQQGWNQNYYEALQKISLDNSISALADLTQFNNQRINADLVEPLGKLRSAIIEDVESRGGLAKTLFTSSEFTKVFDSLSEQYKATGEITSQNIADLAKKNDIIGDYMTVSGANEQAIADLFEIVASGDLSVENITPAIEHFVQRASGAEGAQQEALDVVAEQDLSDSITNMDKWAQNIGKAWYTGRTNDVLGDRPVLEGLKMVLTPEDYADFLRTLAIGEHGGTTSSMITSMKGNMANAYAMLTKLEGSGKKKGKGGGGMDTVYEYLAKEGVFDESGIQYDTKTGRFSIGGDKFADTYGQGNEDKLITFSGLKDYIIESLVGSNIDDETGTRLGYGFKGQGYTKEQASDLATMMLGSMSASSMGTYLTAEGLIDAANTFFGELKGEGQQQGNYITPEQYEALFNQYSDVLATMKMEKENNEWKLRQATTEEMQTEGFKGVTAVEWRQYFIQEARKAGSAIIGIKGATQLGKQDAVTIGKAIADASQGTIKKGKENEETAAIVQAAVAAGVQMYNDYNMAASASSYIYADRNKVGQSLDYDQLQNFYNNVLGLSTDILNSHLEKISEQNGGLAFTHKWTDAYGVKHNVNSRDYGSTGEFTRAIEQENNFSNAILEFQRDTWIQEYFDKEKAEGRQGTAQGALDYVNEMFRREQERSQAAANNTTQSTPTEGENGTKPEGEGETTPEGEGETNANATSTTGIITTPEGAYEAADANAQKKVGKYNDYTYRGNAEAAKVYRYNLLHPNLTPAQAYDKVHSGKVDVDKEWQDKYGPTPEETAIQAQQEAEEAAASMAAEEDLAAAENETNAFISSMSEQEKAQYDAWVKAGGSGNQTEWNALKQRAEEAAIEQATENETATITTTEPDVFISSMSEQEKAQYDAWVKAGGSGSQTEWDALKQRAEEAAAEQAAITNGTLQQPTAQQNMDAHNELYSNYQQAFEAENDFLAENGDFVTNPENAKLAAWTAAARENPDLLGALYQNALEAGYTGDQFTQMYNYQGLQADTRKASEAYKPYAAATFNGSNITAQQRFDFINSAYEKAQKDIGSLTPFEKQVLTMIGEIDDHTGTLVKHGEEEGDAATRAKKNGQIDPETGELVDEEGNPIEMPEGQQPQGGSTGGRESGNNGIQPGGKGPTGKTGGYSDLWGGGDFSIQGLQQAGNMGLFNQIASESGVTGIMQTFGAEAAAAYVEAMNNVGKGNEASGQNNARLLAYASGKEGHIAVTGELGPELRVKSDGSMDILGKTGREYAWVEPDDRIYTASQSAGILKSNKIPGLEGLAKGINNFIPGYSVGDVRANPITTDEGSSGSGGGGSSGGGSRGSKGSSSTAEKDPRYDPQTLKIRDVLERYYTILQQIDNITKAVERFSKVADRAWGRERIRAIEHQNELQQKQYEAQKKYISEIEEYLDTDQSTMTTMIKEFVDGWNKAVDENTDPNNAMERISWAGAQFDQDGILTNYREFVEKLVEQYNQNAASANQETQYKFQEQLKDIQMYTDTLNLYEEQINALEDIKNAILDTAVKVVTYEVEYKLELSGDTDRILNFQADKYKDDVYQAAKYLELLDQRADLTRKNLETVTEGIMKTLGNYAGENMRVGALHTLDELGVYGTNKFEIPEELLEELDEEDEEDAKKLKELQAERSRNITKQIGAWIDEAYATHKDDVEKIEKMLSFSSEEGAGDFTYDENWRDTYDSWEDYYNEVINKTDNDTERFIDNYEEIVGKLNGLVDFQKVRAQIGDWLEELRMKDAEAAAEIDKIVRYTEDGQIANYSDVLEKLNEANVKLNDEFIELLYTDQDAFFEAMSDFSNNPGWVDFTTEHKDQLTNWMDAIYQYLESLQDTYKQTIEQLGDSVKATSKQMDSAIDEFDYYENIYKEFKNIVDLTNREMTDITKGYFDALNSKSMDNAINKIKGTVTNYHLLQGELKEITRQYEEMQARADAATGEEQIFLQQSADKLKEQMDIANSQFEDAHKNYLSAWEDALNKMSEIYKNTLEEASKDFERSFSPLFNTLALLQAQFDREKALGDLYVDNYQRIHDLSKLNRDIAASITDTDNLKGKERLRDLQAEINQLQEDGTELSEYDLDILDKKYKLELARQALEDAKDAKSMVRLARDNNGNWSYVYTANQDDVDKAEQDYEDAIREMEQANEDYIDNIQDQILQVQQEAQQAIIALQPEDFATYDDYLAAVQAIQSSMYDTLNFLRSQMNNAFGNNEWLDPYIINRYGINDHDLTTNFGDTTLAKLLDSDDLDRSIDHARDNFENNLMSPALEAYLTYSQKQQQVYEAAEHNMATIGEDFGKEMEYVAKMSDNEVQIVEKLSDRVQTAFEDMANVVDEKTAKHIAEMDKLVNLYEKLVEAITRVKELSGENLPIEGGQFIGKIDSWAEIQRLNKELAEHGDFRVLEDLTELKPEDLQDRKEAMEKATKKIGEWMETLLVDSVDEETRTAIQDMVEKDENGLITNYKQVISKLAQIEKTDENKDTLKEIKKWRATEQKAMYTSPRQVYKENEGLYTNFVSDDQFTKDYISWITDQLLYKQMKTASEDGVRDTERAEIETYFASHGGVWVQKGDTEEFFDSWTDLQAWLDKNKYVESSGGGGDTPWTTGGWTKDQLSHFSGGYIDTGGYTGRWQSADTGMYTGEWPSGSVRRNGRLAWLHQKELVLNAHDTENFLDAMQIVRQLDNLTNWMANGLGDLIMPSVSSEASELEQNVHIEAEFPNVTNHSEIEQAFNNLVNMASQYANRK